MYLKKVVVACYLICMAVAGSMMFTFGCSDESRWRDFMDCSRSCNELRAECQRNATSVEELERCENVNRACFDSCKAEYVRASSTGLVAANGSLETFANLESVFSIEPAAYKASVTFPLPLSNDST